MLPNQFRMEQDQKQNLRDDEIDLRAVFAAIGGFFVRIWNFFLSLIIGFRRITLKRLYLILVILFLGVVFSAGYYFQRQPFYQTSLLIQSDYLNNRLVENAIDKIYKLIDPSAPQALAGTLGITPELAANIIEIGASPLITEAEVIEIEILQEQLRNLKVDQQQIQRIVNQIQVQNQNAFEITVKVLDPNIFGDLETPLVNYFRNNPYVKRRIEIRKSNLENEKIKLEEELKQMDSLKGVLVRYIEKSGGGKDGSSNFILGDPTVSDPISVFREDYNLYQIYQQVQKSLYLEDDFEVIDGFTPFEKPASSGLIKTIRDGLLISLVFAYTLVFLIEINRYLNKVEKEKFPS